MGEMCFLWWCPLRHIRRSVGVIHTPIIVHIEYFAYFFLTLCGRTLVSALIFLLATCTWSILTGRSHNPIRLPRSLLLLLSAVEPKIFHAFHLFWFVVIVENFSTLFIVHMKRVSGKQTVLLPCLPAVPCRFHPHNNNRITNGNRMYTAFSSPRSFCRQRETCSKKAFPDAFVTELPHRKREREWESLLTLQCIEGQRYRIPT